VIVFAESEDYSDTCCAGCGANLGHLG
jgi:hypothetical protein